MQCDKLFYYSADNNENLLATSGTSFSSFDDSVESFTAFAALAEDSISLSSSLSSPSEDIFSVGVLKLFSLFLA